MTFRGVRDSDPLLTIPRFFTDGDDVAKLKAKIRRVYEWVGWWHEHVPLSVIRMVSTGDSIGAILERPTSCRGSVHASIGPLCDCRPIGVHQLPGGDPP